MQTPSDSDAAVFKDAVVKQTFDDAVRDRHEGRYRDAVLGFEKAIEVSKFIDVQDSEEHPLVSF